MGIEQVRSEVLAPIATAAGMLAGVPKSSGAGGWRAGDLWLMENEMREVEHRRAMTTAAGSNWQAARDRPGPDEQPGQHIRLRWP